MTEKKPAIIHDVWNAILNDLWMWTVVWGEPRCGKTSFKMQVAYEVTKTGIRFYKVSCLT